MIAVRVWLLLHNHRLNDGWSLCNRLRGRVVDYDNVALRSSSLLSDNDSSLWSAAANSDDPNPEADTDDTSDDLPGNDSSTHMVRVIIVVIVIICVLTIGTRVAAVGIEAVVSVTSTAPFSVVLGAVIAGAIRVVIASVISAVQGSRRFVRAAVLD